MDSREDRNEKDDCQTLKEGQKTSSSSKSHVFEIQRNGEDQQGNTNLSNDSSIGVDRVVLHETSNAEASVEPSLAPVQGSAPLESSRKGPLSLLVQGPDGLLFVGTETNKRSLKSVGDGSAGAGDSELEANVDISVFNFEEASGTSTPGLQAVHIVLPDMPNRENPVNLELSGLEPILSPQHVELLKRRMRCFLFLLMLGMSFYTTVFIMGLVQFHRNKDSQNDNTASVAEGLDYLTNAILTSNSIFVAIAYLILYLSLDFIAIFGTLLENVNLLSVYILVEASLSFISAIHAIRPFLVFRVIIILLAIQVRHGILAKRRAIQRLYYRITGESMPQPRQEYFRIWRTRLFASVGQRVLDRWPPRSQQQAPGGNSQSAQERQAGNNVV